MAVTSGFFNSSNHDRLYSNMDVGRMFDGVIRDGVFSGFGSAFQIRVSSGMGITVGTGRAWFEHTWTYNDANIPLTVSTAGSTDRYDWVILEINLNDAVRANSIRIENGNATDNWDTFYNSKQQTLVGEVYWKPLARIKVPANATSIVAANITNYVGTNNCPYVVAAVDNLDISTLMARYDQQFLEWWNQLQHDMGSDVASGLQSQISQVRTDLSSESSSRSGMDTAIINALKEDLFKRSNFSSSYTLAANTRLSKELTFTAPSGYKYAGITGFDTGNKDVCVIATRRVHNNTAAFVIRNVSNAQVSDTFNYTILFIRDFSQYNFTPAPAPLGG